MYKCDFVGDIGGFIHKLVEEGYSVLKPMERGDGLVIAKPYSHYREKLKEATSEERKDSLMYARTLDARGGLEYGRIKFHNFEDRITVDVYKLGEEEGLQELARPYAGRVRQIKFGEIRPLKEMDIFEKDKEE